MTATMPTAAAQRTSARRKRPKWLSAASGPLNQAGEMVQLLGRVLYLAVRHPLGYWGEVREQMYAILKLCWIPMVISTTAFGLGAPGLQGGNLFSLFGIPERLGSFFVMASVREFAPWINAMVVAGVMGTAITADLGARRVREEIDAMEVLGVDPIRTLVLPRVIALTLMTGMLDLLALAFGVLGGYIAAVPILNANAAAFFNNFFANATTTDMWASVVKTAIFGLIVGVVCCYKGLRVEGGPIGVGKAVNQAVVIAFASIWIFNAVFTATLLGLNPSMQVFK
ncbi:ABC transporter permease [Amycolatopsis sp. K13G38]|uniref:ABC transporter permease n=1 Tax=Amycolatopsis acididurans TaxID=2724524 RepID=A0ABX1JHM8_9PSEU|nr:ABC transporter permease [Amycolatopsis acididurans]NKQ57742.1 ABC transporter permease [Amycolatopsis acididurans]